MISEEEMWYSYKHKVKVVTKTNEERIGEVFVFESRYDSGDGEACIWLDDDGYILRQSDISSLEVLK